MEKEKTKGKTQMIIIIILLIIILGLILYICYNKGVQLDQNNNKNQKEAEKNEVVEVEEETKKDIAKKIAYLNTTSIYKSDNFKWFEKNNSNFPSSLNENFYIIDSYYYNNILTKTTTEEEKLEIVLNSLVDDYKETTIPYNEMGNVAQSMLKGYYSELDNTLIEGKYSISSKNVEERYKNLWGKKLTENQTIGDCPKYIYDEENNIYYYIHPCGGTTAPGKIMLYINHYKIKGNNLYAYVNEGHVSLNNNGEDKLFVYSGETIVDNYTEGYTINETNYQKFPEYQYIFKKDENNNYYFLRIEKTM